MPDCRASFCSGSKEQGEGHEKGRPLFVDGEDRGVACSHRTSYNSTSRLLLSASTIYLSRRNATEDFLLFRLGGRASCLATVLERAAASGSLDVQNPLPFYFLSPFFLPVNLPYLLQITLLDRPHKTPLPHNKSNHHLKGSSHYSYPHKLQLCITSPQIMSLLLLLLKDPLPPFSSSLPLFTAHETRKFLAFDYSLHAWRRYLRFYDCGVWGAQHTFLLSVVLSSPSFLFASLCRCLGSLFSRMVTKRMRSRQEVASERTIGWLGGMNGGRQRTTVAGTDDKTMGGEVGWMERFAWDGVLGAKEHAWVQRERERERESEVLGEEERNGQSQNWMSSLPLCCLAPPLLSLSPSLLWFFPLSHTHATTITTQTWLAGWLASSASGVQDFRTQLGRSPLLLLFCGRLGVNFFFLFFFLLNDPHLFFLRLCSSPHDVSSALLRF
ncbi:hypothetical protein IWZ00DRAFT_8132 [Phyllosticta capitalensis]